MNGMTWNILVIKGVIVGWLETGTDKKQFIVKHVIIRQVSSHLGWLGADMRSEDRSFEFLIVACEDVLVVVKPIEEWARKIIIQEIRIVIKTIHLLLARVTDRSSLWDRVKLSAERENVVLIVEHSLVDRYVLKVES